MSTMILKEEKTDPNGGIMKIEKLKVKVIV